MSFDDYERFLDTLERAQSAIFKAQALNNPESMQKAEYALALSKKYLREIEEQLVEIEEIDRNDIQRKKEHIKHLSEAFESIRAY
ncbi:hypothetical protein [Litchfieldia salsa]|uniref:Uncharacterized protein n=1 Tax=Litchfieldia salsa TaxID=930152 RepID=A0A1H0VJ19_9BACI|nr:hypothetical protein [Litchfieldia salsa]SDP78507.1 hypothetical protein SAMN05216565_1072 [Litchfieldia salsa]